MAVTTAVLIGGLVASPIIGGSASASGVTDIAPESVAAAATPTFHEFTLDPTPIQTQSFGYGKLDGSIAMGPATERLVIRPTTPALTPTVTCLYVIGYGEEDIATGKWTAEEWINGEAGFPVDSSRVTLSQPYVQCTSMPAQVQWEMGWSIDLVPEGEEQLTLTQDPATQTYDQVVDRYTDTAAPVTVRAGDVVTVTGAPGSWPTPDGAPRSASGYLQDAIGRVAEFSDGTVSDDGSTVTIIVPTPWDRLFYASKQPGELQIIVSNDTAGRSGAAIWKAPVLLAQISSKTTLALSNSTALSVQRVVATARVRVGEGAPEGDVVFYVDDEVVGTVSVSGRVDGKVTLRLPRLARGSHTVTADYTGPIDVAESSRTVQLRIIV